MSSSSILMEKKGNQMILSKEDIKKIFSEIRTKILEEPKLILDLHFGFTQKMVELIDKDE
jgi:hypothetical protein